MVLANWGGKCLVWVVQETWWKLLGLVVPVGWEISTNTAEACCHAKWWTKKLPANTMPLRTGACILGRCTVSQGSLEGLASQVHSQLVTSSFPKSINDGLFQLGSQTCEEPLKPLTRQIWPRLSSWHICSELGRYLEMLPESAMRSCWNAETTWRAPWPCHLSLLLAERSQSTNVTTKLRQMVPGTSCIAANASSLRGIAHIEWCSSVGLNTWTVERNRKFMWEIHSERENESISHGIRTKWAKHCRQLLPKQLHWRKQH